MATWTCSHKIATRDLKTILKIAQHTQPQDTRAKPYANSKPTILLNVIHSLENTAIDEALHQSSIWLTYSIATDLNYLDQILKRAVVILR